MFVDVGANVGTYAVALAKHVGANGRVIAIEPLPSAGARLAFNAQASQLTNLTLVKAAAGDTDGTLKIENRWRQSRRESCFRHRRCRSAVIPAAHVLNDNAITHIDALKIDVEGL